MISSRALFLFKKSTYPGQKTWVSYITVWINTTSWPAWCDDISHTNSWWNYVLHHCEEMFYRFVVATLNLWLPCYPMSAKHVNNRTTQWSIVEQNKDDWIFNLLFLVFCFVLSPMTILLTCRGWFIGVSMQVCHIWATKRSNQISQWVVCGWTLGDVEHVSYTTLTD